MTHNLVRAIYSTWVDNYTVDTLNYRYRNTIYCGNRTPICRSHANLKAVYFLELRLHFHSIMKAIFVICQFEF